MASIRFHDVIAGLVAIGLLVIIGTLSILGRDVASQIWTAFSSALTYVFGASVQRANGHLTNRRNNP